MFILFPVARSVLTFLRRASFLKCVVPFDSNLTFHRFFGYVCEYRPALVLIAFCCKGYACCLAAFLHCCLHSNVGCDCACSFTKHAHNLDDSSCYYAMYCSVSFLLDPHLRARGQFYQSGKPQGHTTTHLHADFQLASALTCQMHTTAH